jgi:hypothetical protein
VLLLISTIYGLLLHTLGFSVSTSRLLATDLNTETITSNYYEDFLSSTNFLWLSPVENSELPDSIHFSYKHSALVSQFLLSYNR